MFMNSVGLQSPYHIFIDVLRVVQKRLFAFVFANMSTMPCLPRVRKINVIM